MRSQVINKNDKNLWANLEDIHLIFGDSGAHDVVDKVAAQLEGLNNPTVVIDTNNFAEKEPLLVSVWRTLETNLAAQGLVLNFLKDTLAGRDTIKAARNKLFIRGWLDTEFDAVNEDSKSIQFSFSVALQAASVIDSTVLFKDDSEPSMIESYTDFWLFMMQIAKLNRNTLIVSTNNIESAKAFKAASAATVGDIAELVTLSDKFTSGSKLTNELMKEREFLDLLLASSSNSAN